MAQEFSPHLSLCPGLPHSRVAGFSEQACDNEPRKQGLWDLVCWTLDGDRPGGYLPRSGEWTWADKWVGGGEIIVRRTSGRRRCKDPLWKWLFPTSQSDGLIPPREGAVNSFSFLSEHAQPKSWAADPDSQEVCLGKCHGGYFLRYVFSHSKVRRT